MEKRMCIISIIVEDRASAAKVNTVLSEFDGEVVGRMGLPIPQRGVSVITVVVDADMKTVNSVTGKLGMISGVSAKTLVR